jgi:glutamate/tyrosine decarboxylase-like PLP-dependent enzyme
MPKRKPSARSVKKIKKGPSPRKATRSKQATAPAKASLPKQNYTEEYAEYLERYELYGEGRPRLSPAEFDRLDDEMLDLLALESEQGLLSDDQIVRLQELEYLLLDSEQ